MGASEGRYGYGLDPRSTRWSPLGLEFVQVLFVISLEFPSFSVPVSRRGVGLDTPFRAFYKPPLAEMDLHLARKQLCRGSGNAGAKPCGNGADGERQWVIQARKHADDGERPPWSWRVCFSPRSLSPNGR